MGTHSCSGNCRRFRIFKTSTDGLSYRRNAACSRLEDRDTDFGIRSHHHQGGDCGLHATADISLLICSPIIVLFDSDSKLCRHWIWRYSYSTRHIMDHRRRQGRKTRGQEHFRATACLSSCLDRKQGRYDRGTPGSKGQG